MFGKKPSPKTPERPRDDDTASQAPPSSHRPPHAQKVHHRLGEALGINMLGADEGAKVFMYEGLGRLLATKVGQFRPELLAAAAALAIDPSERDVVAHLAKDLRPADVEHAARVVGDALKQLQLTYQHDSERKAWILRCTCILAVGEELLQLTSERTLDWSSLPDAVREGYMTKNVGAFRITLVGGAP
jgi:hypothetical protein